MAYSSQRVLQLSPDEPTLDAPPSAAEAACPKVQLVEGSGPCLTSQTECLLRIRLRAAAMVLFLGSAAFLILRLLSLGDAAGLAPILAAEERLVVWFHLAHCAVLALVTLVLWRGCQRLSMRQLRLAELIIFGWTGVFMLRLQHASTLHSAMVYGVMPDPVAMWFSLIFTYAIFIPNAWRRAAVILGVMAVAPIAWRLIDVYSYDQIAAVARNFHRFDNLVVMMALGYGASLWGTQMIGTLRREAYEARQLGQYRLRHLIGAGGMGEVYLAEHQLLKRPCAIKLIRPNKANDPTALARFEREVRATATLSHWNTVEIFDYGRTDDGTFYYVMEYLPGLSLADLVERYGPMPADRVIYLLRQVCDALREAHAIGLVHRDIKPGNIFAAQRGGVYDVAKLLDFGLAKPLASGDSLQLTQDGAITGSPLFMSPEQALGEREPDARGDIYALGAVAYFLLTGQPPFQGSTAVQVIVALAREEVVPPSQVRPDVPADLEQVVLRSLNKRPDDRFQDAVALSEALADCAAAGGWSRDHAARWWRQTDDTLAAVAG
ncbi:MAG: serine/threonine-protein kinase [Pirellulales bacterium]